MSVEPCYLMSYHRGLVRLWVIVARRQWFASHTSTTSDLKTKGMFRVV